MWLGEKLTEKFKNKRSMCEREVNGKMITEVLLQKSHVTEKERQELGENHVHIWQLKLLPSMIPYGQKGEEEKHGARKQVFKRETFECWWKRGKMVDEWGPGDTRKVRAQK